MTPEKRLLELPRMSLGSGMRDFLSIDEGVGIGCFMGLLVVVMGWKVL